VIPTAVYTAAETLNTFQSAKQPPKLPVFCGHLDLIIHGSNWTHASLLSRRHLDQFSHFAGLENVTNRPRYSVCSNRPHLAIAAMQPNNNTKKETPPGGCWCRFVHGDPFSMPGAITFTVVSLHECRTFPWTFLLPDISP